MKKLIVNADDFGLHSQVNKAVIEALQRGCLRSTSLIAGGRAVEEACQLALENPELGVGVHLTLVAERPVLPREKIYTLVDENGYLWSDHVTFIKKYMQGRIDLRQVYAECRAQLEGLIAKGIRPTHLDSHQHLHVLPGLDEISFTLMKEFGISCMRYPGEGILFSGGYPGTLGRRIAKSGLTLCANLARAKARAKGFSMPGHFFGMLAGGNMQEGYFLNILKSLPRGISEIMVHPGLNNMELGEAYNWHYHWEEEFQSLISERALKYIRENNIELVSYKELLHE